MRSAFWILILGAVIGTAVLFARPWGGGSATPVPGAGPAVPSGSSATQRDAGEGAVEIEVTLLRPGSPDAGKYAAGAQTVFLVAMNTHSVDLGGYNLVTLSELTAGHRRLAPLRWVATSDNNHHRAGALIFPEVDPSSGLELRISSIAGVPVRIFRWAP